MHLIELERSLRQLRLGGMAAVLETRLHQAQAEAMAPLDLIACLVSDELTRRADRSVENHRRKSPGRPLLACGRRRNHIAETAKSLQMMINGASYGFGVTSLTELNETSSFVQYVPDDLTDSVSHGPDSFDVAQANN